MLIEYHRNMLADTARNDAFFRALKLAVKKGASVADIGSGTGLLGFMAKKLGAKDVYFFESGPIMEVAARLAKANKMKGCHFFQGHSTEFLDPPQADVVVSETLGNYAFEENIIATMNDAKRFLKPGGTLIPQAVTHYACPVTAEKYHARFTAWDHVGYGLDYGIARAMSLNNVYVRSFKKSDLLAGATQAWDTVDFREDNSSARSGRLAWKLKNNAVIYGLAVWWDCTLLPGIVLSTGPAARKGHWEQLYFPFLTPIKTKKGDTLSVTIKSESSYESGTDLVWTAALNGKNKQSMDLRKGYLA